MIEKNKIPCFYQNVLQKLLVKYHANKNTWITSAILSNSCSVGIGNWIKQKVYILRLRQLYCSP